MVLWITLEIITVAIWKISIKYFMKITFHGSALNVTGSKHLVETNGKKILLDCGLHQGRRSEAFAKNRKFPFVPSEIDAVVLSHAHADHSGMLPLLAKQGFRGKIYATPATRDVAEYILLDSSNIQRQDAEYFNSHLPEGEEPIEPLYTDDDVHAALDLVEETPYFLHTHKWTQIFPGIKIKFLDAGHILGSSMIVLSSEEDAIVKTIAFSGDLGASRAPLLRDPEKLDTKPDALILECTYGNRTHADLPVAREKLSALIHRAVDEKLKIIVPSFALGRTQEMIYILHQMTDSGQIPRIPIYVDSPLASHITDVFKRHVEEYDEESRKDFARDGEMPLMFRNLIFTESVEDSKALNDKSGPWMVISSSGMCEAGRILHHLANHIRDPKSVIAFTGYQAKHTLGRKILEGESPVKIFGNYFDVQAEVMVFNELSAHADQNGLLEFARESKAPKIALVHTEEAQATAFLERAHAELPGVDFMVPDDGQFMEI